MINKQFSQKNIAIVVDGKRIIQANKYFLKFFGCKTLKKFKKKYSCVSKLFQNDDKHNFLSKKTNGILWSKYITIFPKKEHKVKLLNKKGNSFIFQLDSEIFFQDEQNILQVITFNDITKNQLLKDKLEKKSKELSIANKLLQKKSNKSINKIVDNDMYHKISQKLNLISTISHGLTLKLENNIYQKEDALKTLSKLNNTTEHLLNSIKNTK